MISNSKKHSNVHPGLDSMKIISSTASTKLSSQLQTLPITQINTVEMRSPANKMFEEQVIQKKGSRGINLLQNEDDHNDTKNEESNQEVKLDFLEEKICSKQ